MTKKDFLKELKSRIFTWRFIKQVIILCIFCFIWDVIISGKGWLEGWHLNLLTSIIAVIIFDITIITIPFLRKRYKK